MTTGQKTALLALRHRLETEDVLNTEILLQVFDVLTHFPTVDAYLESQNPKRSAEPSLTQKWLDADNKVRPIVRDLLDYLLRLS